ncbi:Enamine deaminase RidA, house cleaning of reactive enamine intermediates, YjgF/YER057c/UK114 family [Bosea sp. OK403]|uniref:RidA family protein n=1 Tax=Bosea sp. OK403 TaxID=1855286 RepID=UPI0008E3C141|nr:RidA family protein [Bosea sp. OK403]SFI01842.1 Enamine deaminase RidA, house cleaning of reactive enamine intermediates, YjgF/YER057c/UK114 family [Bosea sp. OK403]
MSSAAIQRAILPEGWPTPRGYANGMVAEGRVLVTGGLVGWDETGVFAQGFLPQLRQTLINIKAVVEAGGGQVEDIVRLTWYVTDIAAYRASLKEMGPVYRDVLGRHFPAMAVVQVVALVEPQALIEIEATAVVGR